MKVVAALLWAGIVVMPATVQAWEINPRNGRYVEAVEDMRVKVLGGHVRLTREYDALGNGWKLHPAWSPLLIEAQSHSLGCSNPEAGTPLTADTPSAAYDICRIKRNDSEFKLDASGQALVLKDTSRYVLRPVWSTTTSSKTLRKIAGGDSGTDYQSRVAGYRWEDRVGGDWVEYDPKGHVQRYGDRNNVTVALQYNATLQLIAVKDHHGRTVLTYEYDAENRITAVKDVPVTGDPMPQRTVSYTYADVGDGNPATPVRSDITTVTDVRGNVTTYTYNGKQQLTSVKNSENEILTLSYGSAGKVKTVTEADGATTDYAYAYDSLKKEFTVHITYPNISAGRERQSRVYDVDGRLISTMIGGELRNKTTRESYRKSISEDGLGNKTITETDELGNVTKTTYADGSFTLAKYSLLHGQVEEQIDELGIRATYQYDANGNLTKKIEAAGLPERRTTEYSWDSFGQQLTQTIKGGTVTLPNNQIVTVQDATTIFTYDNDGNRATLTDAENNLTSFTYNRLGQPLITTDARNNVWIKAYDVAGNLTSDTNPLNQTTTYTYDRLNRRNSTVDALNHTTAYAYDIRGNITRITDTLGQIKTRHYDARGRLTVEIDEAGKAMRAFTYNLAGLLAEAQYAGNTMTYEYRAGLQLSSIEDTTLNEALTYDQRGRLLAVTEMLDDTTGQTWRQAYDAKGQTVTLTDRNGKLTQQRFDGLGRLIEVIDPANGRTRYTYDSRDNLLALTDANNRSTVFDYDRNNQTLSETLPAGQIWRYSFDATGNLIDLIDGNGNKIVFTYDAAGLRVGESYTEKNAQQAIRMISFSFNALGNLIGWQDVNQVDGAVSLSATYALDGLQRRTQETLTYGNLSFTIQTAYHPTGRLKSLAYPDGYTVQYGYDAYQGLDSVVLPEGAIQYQQKRWNIPQQILFPGGSQQLQAFDPLMRLIDKRVLSPDQQERYRLTNTYDPESNITRQTGTNGVVEYSYDNLYRLTGADQPWPQVDEAYIYDPLGNRLADSRRGGSQTWSYGSNNQLLQSYSQSGSAVIHSYDDSGSLINNTSTAQEAGLNQHYAYDAANRRTEVRDSSNALIARYQYDPLGRRISKTVYSSAPLAPVTTYFVYGREGLLAEVNAQGETIAAYGWKPEGLWGTNPQFIRTRPQAEPSAPLTTYYYQNDHLGTPRSILDSAGTVVWTQKSYAFGEVAELTSETIKNPLRFPGQYADDETEGYYNYFRDYNPSTGRYVESDPIGLFGGINSYSYVAARPLIWTDPQGLRATGAYGSIWTPGAFNPGYQRGQQGMQQLLGPNGRGGNQSMSGLIDKSLDTLQAGGEAAERLKNGQICVLARCCYPKPPQQKCGPDYPFDLCTTGPVMIAKGEKFSKDCTCKFWKQRETR